MSLCKIAFRTEHSHFEIGPIEDLFALVMAKNATQIQHRNGNRHAVAAREPLPPMLRPIGHCPHSIFFTVVGAYALPATSGHLRYGARVTTRGRCPPDTGTLTRQRQ